MLKIIAGALFLLTAFMADGRADYRYGRYHCHEWDDRCHRGGGGPSINFGYDNGGYYGPRHGRYGPRYGSRRDYYGRGRFEHSRRGPTIVIQRGGGRGHGGGRRGRH